MSAAEGERGNWLNSVGSFLGSRTRDKVSGCLIAAGTLMLSVIYIPRHQDNLKSSDPSGFFLFAGCGLITAGIVLCQDDCNRADRLERKDRAQTNISGEGVVNRLEV